MATELNTFFVDVGVDLANLITTQIKTTDVDRPLNKHQNSKLSVCKWD